MPQESSAVADLVSLAHREPIHMSPDPHDPRNAPDGSRSLFSGPWIVLIGLIVIGASVAGGYFMARQEAAPAEPGEAASVVAAAETPDEDPTPIVAPADAAEAEIEPEQTPPAEVDMELAKVTGFDVLVEPSGAKVSLDGQAIGAAPLRVRNLLPGKHVIDIDGPNGYFGKHLEFNLSAGEAEVLTLVLDPVSEGLPAAAATESTPEGEGDDPERVESASEEESEELAAAEPTGKKQRGKKDKRDRRRRFKASADEEKILRKAEKVALGTLMLGAKPPCDIIINGKRTGLKTPQRAIQLPAGMHRVVLVNKKHDIRKAFKVRIKPGLTTRAIQDLSAKL